MPSQQPEPLTVVVTINTASVGRNAYADVTCPACAGIMVLVEGSKRNRKVNERICQESDGGCGSNLSSSTKTATSSTSRGPRWKAIWRVPLAKCSTRMPSPIG